MKNQLTFLLVILLLSACNNSVNDGKQDNTLSNSNVIQGLYDAFAEGNIDAVLAGMDSTIVWNEAESFIYADNNPYVGPQAVLEGVFGRIGADFEYFNVVPSSVEELGDDGILAQGRYKGKLKSNGAELDAQFAHVWRLKDMKVISFQQYTDTKQTADVFAAEAVKELDEDMGS